jgi:branched-subunit amino acid aminotransferase/4-amino-4-deoxychorismate lyase
MVKYFFSSEKNFERINKSAKRLAIPEISEEMFMDGLKALVDIDRDWIPHGEGMSLYLRPLLFATEEALKARISEKYMFAIVATPAKIIIPLRFLLKLPIIIQEQQVEVWVLQKQQEIMLLLSIQPSWQ